MEKTGLTNYFSHGGDIGDDAEVLLGPAVGDAEAGHHLVEDQEGAVLGAEVSQPLQELLGGLDEAGVAHHGLQDHRGHVGRLQQSLYAGEIVVCSDQCAPSGALRNS